MWEHHFSGLVDNQKLGILSDHLDNNGWYVSSTGEQSSIDLDYRQAPDIEFDLDIISEFAKENHLTSKKIHSGDGVVIRFGKSSGAVYADPMHIVYTN